MSSNRDAADGMRSPVKFPLSWSPRRGTKTFKEAMSGGGDFSKITAVVRVFEAKLMSEFKRQRPFEVLHFLFLFVVIAVVVDMVLVNTRQDTG